MSLKGSKLNKSTPLENSAVIAILKSKFKHPSVVRCRDIYLSKTMRELVGYCVAAVVEEIIFRVF